MSYEKPPGLLRDVKQKRIRAKSAFLRKLEQKQYDAAEAKRLAAKEQGSKVVQLHPPRRPE